MVYHWRNEHPVDDLDLEMLWVGRGLSAEVDSEHQVGPMWGRHPNTVPAMRYLVGPSVIVVEERCKSVGAHH